MDDFQTQLETLLARRYPHVSVETIRILTSPLVRELIRLEKRNSGD